MVDHVPLLVEHDATDHAYRVTRPDGTATTVTDELSNDQLRHYADACLAVLASRRGDGALAVECPVCGAGELAPCTVGLPDPSVSSILRERPHHARELAARGSEGAHPPTPPRGMRITANTPAQPPPLRPPAPVTPTGLPRIPEETP